MNVANVERLSIGQWAMICEGWNVAHADKPKAPSDDEFEAAVAQAREVGL